MSAVQIERAVRAFNPAPGAWFELAGERIKVLGATVLAPSGSVHGAPPGTIISATTSDGLIVAANPGALRLDIIQRAGRAAMASHDLLRGFTVTPGTRAA